MTRTGYLTDGLLVYLKLLSFDMHELARGPAPPAAAELVAAHPPVDQGDCQGCVAYSLGPALWDCATASGLTLPLPSSRAIYANGRARQGGRAALGIDGGLSPSQALDACQELGWPSIDDWPDTSPLDELPPAGANAPPHAAAFHRIDGSVATRIDAARRALAAQLPVLFGSRIDAAYQRLGPGAVWGGPTGPAEPHYQRLVGYAPGVFRVRGSWGVGWCDAGDGWITDAVLGASSDLYLLELVR